MIFPTKETTPKKDHIIIDTKTVAIWDHCNLAKFGGIIPLNGKYALEVVKCDSKWIQWYLIQYGVDGVKRSQSFNAVKTVRDTSKEKELRDEIKRLISEMGIMRQDNKKLRSELAEYKVSTSNTISSEVVEL